MTSPALGDTFGRRLRRWLDRFNLIDDPFALQEADQEREYLPHFFVDRPYLHEVLGNPARPQATFLMAARGAGKSATREMVFYECSHASLRRKALAVRYDDFMPLLEQVNGNPAALSARHHIQQILRAATRVLAQDVPALYFELLTRENRQLLMSYAGAFSDPISKLRLAQLLHVDPIALPWHELSPRELLEEFAGLVTQLGESPASHYQALYVLIDRVDETSLGPSGAVGLLKPLVSEGPLLEAAKVALKFFLPLEVGEKLQVEAPLRPDRVGIHRITWDDRALQEMIHQRLFYYSGGQVASLKDLCRASAMDRLISVCEGSPRTLLHLCRSLILAHVQGADERSTYISNEDVLDTIRVFLQQRNREKSAVALDARSRAEQVDAIQPGAGLHLDAAGHVWVDGESIDAVLSPLEHTLLLALWRQGGRVVPNEELIEAVWPTTTWKSAETINQTATQQNLRKLIDRLRRTLPGDPDRFVKNVRGRGYWLKASGD